ncbi:carbon-nitrogen hydrolase family protein [Agrobacterium sp. SHOUNA12C]|uniref:CN hydrolase domain-containing protein n=1 Tax=Rhizobium rhizogenes NBRC 13257 TaxID=1220581 RepID=A0AA87Q2N7_RHIRH|nr:carbon-nitrogen hydrolase family protein [Rhizobium rhizogenes]KAA6491306.1 carbon-nitrogen hydrolase family protein [Agrobacterium sp. ICMP 7243]MCJ9722893.1 carbon-nitrogen hydrolase family protein [Agrobacterium sp. BETTINA12B]MCJ9759857.1 carbon-nitrogen hydrolase family protein [Agrobacterium sp. SHOUNA12C]NTF47762.1 carbon-nitrogen hydrolase family protein [Rhizobium rhizogenes]NTF54258.1 carbon-nitrogen hydrolase family protein [Rhizobium rhizogenes]
MAKWDGAYTWHKRPSAIGAPDRLRVATCQIPVGHDIAVNAAQILSLIEAAAEAGADVAHFPECALSGYGSANWPDWTGFDWFGLQVAVEAVQSAARRHRVWVATGCVHRDDATQKKFNSLYVFNRDGQLAGRYDKRCCSTNDQRAFELGRHQLILDIEGVSCGFLICRDWSYPELWRAYEGQVELVFHSACADGQGRDKNETHTIPPLMQAYGRQYVYAVSSANSCRYSQDYPSLWVERGGYMGGQATRHEAGFTMNALADDPEQDRFFAAVLESRRAERILYQFED